MLTNKQLTVFFMLFFFLAAKDDRNYTGKSSSIVITAITKTNKQQLVFRRVFLSAT